AETHRGGCGREVARYCILHLRKRNVAPLLSHVELHVAREPRHRGSARVGYRPCRLQFLVHLLEKGDAAGNWRGGASIKLPDSSEDRTLGGGGRGSPRQLAALSATSWSCWPRSRDEVGGVSTRILTSWLVCIASAIELCSSEKSSRLSSSRLMSSLSSGWT